MGHGPEKNQEMKKGAADKVGPITSSCPGKESVFLSLFGENAWGLDLRERQKKLVIGEGVAGWVGETILIQVSDRYIS